VLTLRGLTEVFDSISPFELAVSTLSDVAEPRRIRLECMSSSMFRVLGVQPRVGRAFDDRDDRPGAPPVVVITHTLWRSAFGARASVGDTLRINDHAVTLIGILPPEIDGVRSLGRTDAWAPIGAATDAPSETGCRVWGASNVYARIRSDLTVARADERLR